MSEYPVSCAKCGKYCGLVYATDWHEKYLCNKCWDEWVKEKECEKHGTD